MTRRCAAGQRAIRHRCSNLVLLSARRSSILQDGIWDCLVTMPLGHRLASKLPALCVASIPDIPLVWRRKIDRWTALAASGPDRQPEFAIHTHSWLCLALAPARSPTARSALASRMDLGATLFNQQRVLGPELPPDHEEELRQSLQRAP